MAEWVSHLIVADRVLEQLPWLKRHEFCVGSIAPDCNIPNEDWSAFTPSREVTHWMDGNRKDAADSQRFCQQYIFDRLQEIRSEKELSFLFGYYAHLITDAEFQRTTRDAKRVAAAWQRAQNIPEIRLKAKGMEESWDNFKKLFPDRKERYCGLQSIEREYLDTHPESGFFTEIQGLESFPDYLDYLPQGAIPAKIKLMYCMPEPEKDNYPFVGFSREEYNDFLDRAAQLSVGAIKEARERIIAIEEHLKNPCKASSLPL